MPTRSPFSMPAPSSAFASAATSWPSSAQVQRLPDATSTSASWPGCAATVRRKLSPMVSSSSGDVGLAAGFGRQALLAVAGRLHGPTLTTVGSVSMSQVRPSYSWASWRAGRHPSRSPGGRRIRRSRAAARTSGSSSTRTATEARRCSRRSCWTFTSRAGRRSSCRRNRISPGGSPCLSNQASVSRPATLGTTGEVDHLVDLGEPADGLQPDLQGRVVDSGGEERAQSLGWRARCFKSVPDVGEDAVDVDDGEHPRRLGGGSKGSRHQGPDRCRGATSALADVHLGRECDRAARSRG